MFKAFKVKQQSEKDKVRITNDSCFKTLRTWNAKTLSFYLILEKVISNISLKITTLLISNLFALGQ